MLETATVMTIDGDLVTVVCANDRCESCSSSFCTLKDRTFTARKTRDLDVRVGDVVEVYLSPTRTLTSGFMAFVLPLALFVGCYALAAGAGISSEVLKVIVGLFGVGAGFGLNLLFSRTRVANDPPVIVRTTSVKSSTGAIGKNG